MFEFKKRMLMKHILLLVSLLLFSICLHSQNDTTTVVRNYPQKTFVRETAASKVSIYPVPVRENSFTIKTDRDIVSVKVTNMIGQDIFKAQYKSPVLVTKVLLERPRRGIYLVTIAFSDGTKIVRKVMIEGPE